MLKKPRTADDASPRWRLIGVAILATLALFAWALYARQRYNLGPLSSGALTHLAIDPYAVGIAVRSFIVPLVLLYLFSTTTLFRQAIGGQPVKHLSLKLIGALGTIQLLARALEMSLFSPDPDMFMLGLLVVMVAGLLGGWPTGLALGAISMLIFGTHVAFFDLGTQELFSTLCGAGWWETPFVCAGRIFLNDYVLNPRTSAPIWVGLVTGLAAGLLGKHRFNPLVAWLWGSAMGVGVGYVFILTAEQPAWMAGLTVPNALASGLALGGIALFIRNLQAEDDQRKAATSELALARAELRALRAQINPHFLFNALNTIRYCVRTDPEAARQLLLDLSEVFQHILRSGEFVPLREEIGHVQAYLALEKARLGERLRVKWRIQNQPTNHLTPQLPNHLIDSPFFNLPVPTLILQPIVENAVVHGIAQKPEGGQVSIIIEQVGQALVIQVQDDGVGIGPDRLAEILSPVQESKAIGLHNVDSRLRALYGDAYRLIVESQVGQGTRVQIHIPITQDKSFNQLRTGDK